MLPAQVWPRLSGIVFILSDKYQIDLRCAAVLGNNICMKMSAICDTGDTVICTVRFPLCNKISCNAVHANSTPWYSCTSLPYLPEPTEEEKNVLSAEI